LKDNDFIEGKRRIELGNEQKKLFMERLKRDVNVRFEKHTLTHTNRFFFLPKIVFG